MLLNYHIIDLLNYHIIDLINYHIIDFLNYHIIDNFLLSICLSKIAKSLEQFLNDLQDGTYDAPDPKIKVSCQFTDKNVACPL